MIQEHIDNYEQLTDELLSSQQEYMVLEVSFRVTKYNDGSLKVVEIYDDSIYILFGLDDNPDLTNDLLIHFNEDGGVDKISEVGFYEAKMLLIKDGDSDEYRTWDWWEVQYLSIINFWTLEQTEEFEIEYENRKPDSETDDELPF